MLFYALIAILWVACAVAHAGLFFAYYQRMFGRSAYRADDMRVDRIRTFWTMLLGPAALVTTIVSGQCTRGWLWPWSQRARDEASGVTP